MRRFLQVAKYGYIHAGEALKEGCLKSRISVFFDIMLCYSKYGMWSNQYMAEKMYRLNTEEKRTIGEKYRKQNEIRDAWQRDFQDNKKFLIKYSSKKYELARLRKKRNKAYQKRYHMGRNTFVEYDVEISRQHYLPGTICVGKNVLFAKHSFVDYSGDVIIEDYVQITDGVHIITHDHMHHHAAKKAKDFEKNDIKGHLIIKEGAVIGTRAVILSSCHYIGKYARVGAGAVVTQDVPDYTVCVGVPAKQVKLLEQD